MRTISLLFFPLFAFVFSCQSSVHPDQTRWEKRAEHVTIIRDDFGVAHVYGDTDADAVFGMLYAQAEDDFRRIERNYVWATGRLAELEGKDAIYSDLRAAMYMSQDEAIAAYESAPQWLKELCIAFADGLNYYLHTHPEVEPRVITRYEPWMPMYFFEGSIGGDIESIPTQRIKAFYESDSSFSWIDYHQTSSLEATFEEPKGSNGIAISGNLTASGNAMLLINPHTSFYFRPEIHVISNEGLNAYGAVTWGQFFIYQGFNEKTGWMHTSTFVDFIDEFVHTVSKDEDGNYTYLYGDEQRPIEVKNITIKYLEGDALLEKSFPIYRTHQGPVTHSIDGKWVVTRINWDPVNALIQSFTRTKQSGYEDFKSMMNIRTNSSNNTVFADAEGNIAYFHGNFIPKRDPSFDYSKPVDGSNPKTDWQGLHTVDESITLLNPTNGWIQNCNSTPFTAAAEFSPKPENYPSYMAPDVENFRGLHAVNVLTGIQDLTLDGLIKLAYDPTITGFEYMLPPLFKAFDRAGAGYKKLEQPIKILQIWDYKTSKESVAMSLAHYYGVEFSRSIGNVNGLIPFNKNLTLRDKMSDIALLETLLAAVQKLENDFGSWNIAWGEINRFQRLSGDINLSFDDEQPSLAVGLASGRWGALASYGAVTRDTKKMYGTSGNSFIAVVEFGDRVKAKSLLAGGNSSNPSSAHFYDQAQRYADGLFKDVAFYREDVESRAKYTYKPGQKF
jgi:acyl-homoserine lactone acylase PvdQ